MASCSVSSCTLWRRPAGSAPSADSEAASEAACEGAGEACCAVRGCVCAWISWACSWGRRPVVSSAERRSMACCSGVLLAAALLCSSVSSAVAMTSTPSGVLRLDRIRVPAPKAMRALARASREVGA